MVLQYYSNFVAFLDFCYMVCRAFVVWMRVIFGILFPKELKPINGKIVLVGPIFLNLQDLRDKFEFTRF